MEAISNQNVIAFLISLIAGLLLYAAMVPRNTGGFSMGGAGKPGDSRFLRFSRTVGAELHATLPSGVGAITSKPHPQIESLITRAGNPWNLTVHDFLFLQWVTAFMGFVAGWAAWFGLSFVTSIPWFVVVPLATLLGFMYPRNVYGDQAKRRDLEFKRQLPEALDLITISLAGGMTFAQAVRESLPNMQPGVLKEEFKDVIASIDTGRTLNETLERFGSRAPSESVKTFVQAVKEANELNVPLTEVLQSRAEASRDEFFALIHAKTAQLSSKMMAVLTPTLIPALLIIVLTPSLGSLLNTLTG